MEKKLPKVFENKINKELHNNKKVYKSAESKDNNNDINIKKYPNAKKIQEKIPEQSIEQKIDGIINSRNYIYKIPVKIQTQEGEIITKIIGKNKYNVITIENELIKIENIKNIEIYED